MAATVPRRHPLGYLPTPLVDLPRLSAALGGPRIRMKRDDQTGLALGGNKTRKLEYLVADALEQGADTLVTAGAAQSNHCRQTAAAAVACGLRCDLVLGGGPPEVANGNLLLDELLGAHVHWAGAHRKGEDIPAVADDLRAAGHRPYVVPYGGSSAVGAIGFVEAVGELAAQLDRARPPSHVVFASSSGGTHAGMLAGMRRYGQRFEPVGIQIDKEGAGDAPFAATVTGLARATAERLELRADPGAGGIGLCTDYAGAYGVVGVPEREAIGLVARTEGILLDPVYTGRAMAGLVDLVGCGRLTADDDVVFWHTGGTPALFAYAADLLG